MTPKYAGFWIRLLADIFDSIILTIAASILEYVFLWLLYGIVVAWQSHLGIEAPVFAKAFTDYQKLIFNSGLYLCLSFPYYVWGNFKWGTTLGKLPLKIYVVNAVDQAPITLKQSMIRYFMYIVSYLPFCAGFIMAAFHPKKQGLHELAAGTISVRRERYS